MSEEIKNKAIEIAGDGTNRDGETTRVSVGGYNVTLVNKGGLWYVSSWQKVSDESELKLLAKLKQNSSGANWNDYTSGMKQQYGI